MHAWAFPLVAWNFSSKKSSSPFLAWANTFYKEHPTYSVIKTLQNFIYKHTADLENVQRY